MEATLRRISAQIREAAASGTALRIRGGGSKDFYGRSLTGEVLDTRGLNGIVSYEPSELVVTVQAGTPLEDLEAALAEQGQCLPFEPPRYGHSTQASAATVGGMVSAGLSGPARASVGSVRDYVLGAKLINGRGEQLTFGGQVMKNVAGYDVSRLLAGAMGTLGVLTEVSLKVLPVAPAQATLVFEMAQADALEALHRWGGQPLPLNASCWVHDRTTSPPRDLLFVRLRGAVAAVETACQKMLAEAGGLRMDERQADADWSACRDLRLPFFVSPSAPDLALWRLSVAQTAPVLPWAGDTLVEWHGGQRWVWAPASEGAVLQDIARRAGGHATLFWAQGDLAPWASMRFAALNPSLDALHRRLKAAFDPAGILNPGRLF